VKRAAPPDRPPDRSPADCRSCGRFIGPVLTCPYCGAFAEGRLPLRVLRYAALAIGIAGLALLTQFARSRETPLMPLGDLTPTMNFGRVRVAGWVARAPYLATGHGRTNYLSFVLDDGTNQITVAAYERIAQTLVVRKRVPERGARVEVTGTVNVGVNGRIRLQLQDAEESIRNSAPSREADAEVR
jgi:hypothetical protein